MNKEKIEYMIEQRDKEKTTKVTIDLDDEVYRVLLGEAKKLKVDIEDYVYSITLEKLIEHEKELLKSNHSDIIDIYDMYKLEELIETKKEYLIINPNGKHVVLIPIDKYEEMMDNLKD